MARRGKPTPVHVARDLPTPDCRFHPTANTPVQKGHFRSWRDENCVDLIEHKNQAVRTVRAEWVELRVWGPRGGETWQRAVWPMVPSPPKGT